jgi:hypothetical protein
MEFLSVFVIFPIISFLLGVIGQILIKRIYIVVGIIFLGWLFATFTIFNSTFLIWVFVYSALAFLGSGLVYFLKKLKIQ